MYNIIVHYYIIVASPLHLLSMKQSLNFNELTTLHDIVHTAQYTNNAQYYTPNLQHKMSESVTLNNVRAIYVGTNCVFCRLAIIASVNQLFLLI